MISPIVPTYKMGLRKQPYHHVYLPNRKNKESFKEILDKETSKKSSVRI